MRILILARATDVELSMPHKSNRITTTRTTGGPRDAKAGVLSATYGFEELDKYAEIHTYFEGSRRPPSVRVLLICSPHPSHLRLRKNRTSTQTPVRICGTGSFEDTEVSLCDGISLCAAQLIPMTCLACGPVTVRMRLQEGAVILRLETQVRTRSDRQESLRQT